MKKIILFAGLLSIILLLTVIHVVRAEEPNPCWINSLSTETSANFSIKYFKDDGTGTIPPGCSTYPLEAVTQAEAQLLANDFEAARQHFINLNFNQPLNGILTTVWVLDYTECDPDDRDVNCASSRGRRIKLHYKNVRNVTSTGHNQTVIHELFHLVQSTYAADPNNIYPENINTSWIKDWIKEGTPKLIQECLYPENDLDPTRGFFSHADLYLENLPGLIDTSYTAALFWKYFTEQIGTNPPGGPDQQLNALVWLYNEMDQLPADGVQDDHEDIFERIFTTVANQPNMTFTKLYHDFIITNYVRLKNNVSSRFRYQDELDQIVATGDNYGNIKIFFDDQLSPSHPIVQDPNLVGRWTPIYYVGRPTTDCKYIHMDLHSSGTIDQELIYAVLAIRDDKAYYHDHEGFRAIGGSLTKTFRNENFDQVVAVVSGKDYLSFFGVEMKCIDPQVKIISPLSDPDQRAEVGDHANPRPFILRLEVKSGDSFVEGLDRETFKVSIGSEQAEIIDAKYVQDQYWLVIDTPNQSSNGLYDVQVTMDILPTTTEPDAVRYAEAFQLDEVLVIDRSGSMNAGDGYPKIQAAKNAATLYVDEMTDNDQLGVVSYNGLASVDHHLLPVNPDNRKTAKNEINDLEADGCTSIGEGLITAFDLFNWHGIEAYKDVIVLLSDGVNTCGISWEDVKEIIIDAGIVVNTVALGPGELEDLMDQIARDTGGKPYQADLPDQDVSSTVVKSALQYKIDLEMASFLGVNQPTLPSPPPSDNEGASLYHLSNIYDFIENDTAGRQRILAQELTAGENQLVKIPIFLDDSLSQVNFSLSYNQPSTLNGTCDIARQVKIIDPISGEYLPSRTDAFHDVFEIDIHNPDLLNKPWEISLQLWYTGVPCIVVEKSETDSIPIAPYRILAMVSAETDLTLEMYIQTPVGKRPTGTRIPILAYLLSPSGIVTGADIQGSVAGCGYKYPLTFRDDGKHNDGEASDGIWGAYFTQTTCEGGYRVSIEERYGNSTRQELGSFYISKDTDSDGDGISDSYEQANGLNPSIDDAWGDLDYDYLPNLVEYAFGTNPGRSDTDGGGEADVSELFWQQDAINDPDDDQIDAPRGFDVEAGIGENIIRFYINKGFDGLRLRTSTSPTPNRWNSNWKLIDNTGEFIQTGLTNDIQYYYWLIASTPRVRPFGSPRRHVSGYANPASAMPRLDPYPPVGFVLINDDAQSTNSVDVTLTIFENQDAVEMLISNQPDEEGAVWEAFAPVRAWTLAGSPGKTSFVYVRLKDAAGNISDWFLDGIVIE